jgi:hypothetical protein
MKKYVDLRSERQLEVDQQVYLRLQPYRQNSVVGRRSLKLAPRLYGPFTILRKIGTVAYELDLPSSSRIHPVFHVSQLKPKLGSSTVVTPLLPLVNEAGIIQPEPAKVLLHGSRPKNNHPLTELLIRWAGQSAKDATWVEYSTLKNAYPHLAGKVF